MLPEINIFDNLTIYMYGLCIVIGGHLSINYMAFLGKKELNIERKKIIYIAFIMCLSSFVGGKFFYFLKHPNFFFGTPSNMLLNLGNGFVFFGSLIFAIPSLLWFFKNNNWPVWQMFDIMAFVAIIVHFFGRIGCFMAGCCFGIPTNRWMGIVFSDPKSSAPLHVHLHPTQLYEISLIGSIGLFLFWFKDRKEFHGQLWLLYLILYSSGRIFIDMYRGDSINSFIIDGILTHSQLISIVFIITVSQLYIFLKRNKSFYG